MRKISTKISKESKNDSNVDGNAKINDFEASNNLDKADTSQIFLTKVKDVEMMNDTIQSAQTTEQSADAMQKRRQLHIVVFLAIIALETVFTIYPAFIFARTSGAYEFFLMEFTFPIPVVLISIYLLRKDIKQFLLLHFMLDPLMIITLCLIATYIFPYIAMDRVNLTQVLEEVGYFICNLAMVGNYRTMLLYMKWTAPKVILYKLSKLVAILFYLCFGTYYVLKDISYSKNTDSDLDGKVQDLVILFVFSGFALQLEIFNRASDFDGTSDLKSHYLIEDENEQDENQVLNPPNLNAHKTVVAVQTKQIQQVKIHSKPTNQSKLEVKVSKKLNDVQNDNAKELKDTKSNR